MSSREFDRRRLLAAWKDLKDPEATIDQAADIVGLPAAYAQDLLDESIDELKGACQDLQAEHRFLQAKVDRLKREIEKRDSET